MELTITLALVNSFIYFLLFNKWFKAIGAKACSFCILWWACFIEAIAIKILNEPIYIYSFSTIATAMAMTCISVTAYFYLKNNQ